MRFVEVSVEWRGAHKSSFLSNLVLWETSLRRAELQNLSPFYVKTGGSIFHFTGKKKNCHVWEIFRTLGFSSWNFGCWLQCGFIFTALSISGRLPGTFWQGHAVLSRVLGPSLGGGSLFISHLLQHLQSPWHLPPLLHTHNEMSQLPCYNSGEKCCVWLVNGCCGVTQELIRLAARQAPRGCVVVRDFNSSDVVLNVASQFGCSLFLNIFYNMKHMFINCL